MNWPGVFIALGLLWLSAITMPWGLLILAAMAWAWRKG